MVWEVFFSRISGGTFSEIWEGREKKFPAVWRIASFPACTRAYIGYTDFIGGRIV